MTALAIIFTVGLGEKVAGEMSAYSAFNRGFQKLMGSVDVEALVNQHVGGGMMMAAGGDAGMIVDEGNDRNRRQQRLGNNNIHNARRDGPNEEEQANNDDGYDSNNDDEGGNGQQRQHARKSGKKNRRRNQEDRQDQRLQREAARVMGLDGAGGHEEAMAMQRLIEEQVAAGDHNQE